MMQPNVVTLSPHAMRRALACFAAILVPAGALAQVPLAHFTDAVQVRAARSVPIVSYALTIDAGTLSDIAVEMRIGNAPDTVRLAMAAHPEYDDKYWRYLEGLTVVAAGQQVTPVREDSALWRITTRGGQAVVRYRIHLPAATPTRAAWKPFLSPTGGLVGGPHSFLYIVGATLTPSHVTLELPPAWEVATGMEPTVDPHVFFAPTVDALLDSPMLVGRFHTWRFTAGGVPHRVVYWNSPAAIPFDTVAFARDVQQIADQGIALFGRAPYRDYTFIIQDGAFGALEHRNSLTLGAPSADLARSPASYFGSIAHEFTHTWNLMRIRPLEIGDVSWRPQPPVAGLWFSEGFTMRYADRFVRLAGLPSFESTVTDHLQSLVARYYSNPGNAHFSAEQISRVAFNAEPGALGDYSPSVHLVGELLSVLLDLTIRDATAGERSVDDVMRRMLDQYAGARGFTGRDVERVVTDVCSCDVHRIFTSYVRGASSMDFNLYLGLAGLRADTTWVTAVGEDGKPLADLRMRTYPTTAGAPMRVVVFHPESAWAHAGLHTGDRLLAVNDRRVTAWAEVAAILNAAHVGDSLRVDALRGSTPLRLTVVMRAYTRPTVRVSELPNVTARQRVVRDGVLGVPARVVPF